MHLRASAALQLELVSTAHKLATKGWVANHDGNVTARVANDRFLATPTATAKADVQREKLLEVDASGAKLAGGGRAFGELSMHLAVYAQRPDVHAVVHAHPPYATALACSGSKLIETPFIAEAVVSLGARIPTLPFAAPGKDSADAIARAAGDVDGVLLASHGVITWGASLELAFLRMELIEHLARIATLSIATGGPQPLPASVMTRLLEARSKAGLGAAADRALELAPKRVVACAPAPHAAVSETLSPRAPTSSGSSSDLATIIREELQKLL